LILQVPLPHPLPATGAQVKLRFQRVPVHSYVVRPILDGAPQAALDTAYLYGRGEGSTAREQAWVNVRLPPAAVTALAGRPSTLSLAIESLDGRQVDASDLQLVDHELHPL
jgi:hypothetical protein